MLSRVVMASSKRDSPSISEVTAAHRAAGRSKKEARTVTDLARKSNQGGATKFTNLDQEFPQRAYPDDPRDEDMAIWHQLTNGNPAGLNMGVPVQPYVQIGQKHVDYIKDKMAFQEDLAFRAWAANKFDLTDPANVKMMNEIMPEYLDKQWEFVLSRIEVIKKWLELKIRGYRSKEDLLFHWMVETGRIVIPQDFTATGLLQSGIAGRPGLDMNSRGLFNPLRYFAMNYPDGTKVRPPANEWGIDMQNRYNVTGPNAGRFNALQGTGQLPAFNAGATYGRPNPVIPLYQGSQY